jgi:CubicO group peptidase (beta-lactamase class C family)
MSDRPAWGQRDVDLGASSRRSDIANRLQSPFHSLPLLRLVVAAAIGLCTHAADAQTPARKAPPELNADNIAGLLNPLMGEWIGKRNGPGAVVVVVTSDKQTFAQGYGMADYAAKRPFTADATLVRPGSISKLFTAIAVMQLVEAGKLDLDRDVNAYIDFTIPLPDGGVPVTLRQLLSHRAGFEEHMKGLFSKARDPEPLGQWLKKSLPRRLFPNGDVEAYSNYGFALAGYIVERVSGEPFADYMQRQILEPLGMQHSTFRQTLPDDLAPLMAKGYRRSDQPPVPFETIIPPPGALSATGEDMGRFMRALLNGGELDGVRILSKARLDEMMAPINASAAGSIGLAFVHQTVAGHPTVGHDGATLTFFSTLVLFPEHGIGIFSSRVGLGDVASMQDLLRIPSPKNIIARRFLPKATTATEASAENAADDGRMSGVYHVSRRADSTLLRLQELQGQFAIRFDSSGDLHLLPAAFPFGAGITFKRLAQNLYEGPANSRLAYVEQPGGDSHFAQPGLILQRAPWWLDMRWVAPALVAGLLIVLLSLIAWPVAALWRLWRKKPWSKETADRRWHLAVRLVLLIDTAVILATILIFALGSADYAILGDALDPYLIALYAFAWAGVLGAVLALWAAISFWRRKIGGRWSRIHHSLIALGCLILAWFFVVFHIAGTSLNY